MNNLAKIPNHIGIIMDGNGRWATQRNKKRSYGHKVGSDNVDTIAMHCFSRGVRTLTLYAFSCENWQRPKEEVDELMRLLDVYLKKFTKKLIKNKIKLHISGDITVLSDSLQKTIEDCLEKTSGFNEYILNIALNYGGKQEIVMAVNKLIKENKEVTVEAISQNLYTAPFGEPDLIIRTGGECRLSNFLLFQGAYSELYFTDTLWPDFKEEQFDLALESFTERKRRFGKV